MVFLFVPSLDIHKIVQTPNNARINPNLNKRKTKNPFEYTKSTTVKITLIVGIEMYIILISRPSIVLSDFQKLNLIASFFLMIFIFPNFYYFQCILTATRSARLDKPCL